MQTSWGHSEKFINERNSEETLIVRHTNWGEPYAEGVRFEMNEGDKYVAVDLEKSEALRLYKLLGKLLKV